MLRNSRGFSLIETLLLVFVLVVLGGVGYYVFESKKTAEQTYINTLDSPVEASKKVKIVAVGDISCSDEDRTKLDLSKNCTDKETYELAKSLDPQSVLLLGDLQYSVGALDQFNNNFDKTWGQFLDISYPTPGNHEHETPGANGYYKYFSKSPHYQKIKEGYYSFDLGGWHIISLDSTCDKTNNCSADSQQIKWLEQDLSKNNTKCTLAFWHYPRYTSGRYFSQGSYKDYTEQFWQKLSAYKADVVLSGHDHIYERFASLDSSGNSDKTGIKQFVAGSGGRSLYERKITQNNTDFISDDNYGVLELELEPSKYSWKFHNLDNKILDSGSSNCN